MKITVRLFAHFLNHLPDRSEGREAVIPLTQGKTVAHLIEQLGISPELPKVILVNGQIRGLGDELHDGDRISILPPAAGG